MPTTNSIEAVPLAGARRRPSNRHEGSQSTLDGDHYRVTQCILWGERVEGVDTANGLQTTRTITTIGNSERTGRGSGTASFSASCPFRKALTTHGTDLGVCRQ